MEFLNRGKPSGRMANNENFLRVNLDVLHKFNLDLTRYAICDSIHKLSINGKGRVPGWCTQSKKEFAKRFNIKSEKTVFNILNDLERYGLIQRNEWGNLKTTAMWNNEF